MCRPLNRIKAGFACLPELQLACIVFSLCIVVRVKCQESEPSTNGLARDVNHSRQHQTIAICANTLNIKWQVQNDVENK
ncbi:hypothetical protein BLOT_009916 [Blomia tropicalis]|nr:hypothetical protein BLOT_009916 [Blomia tropicalis]